MIRCRFQEVRNERNSFALARLFFRLGLGGRIHRTLRSAVDRRLRQHVVLERDRLPIAPLGVAAAPLLGNRTPIGAGFLLERRARLLIFAELAAIFRDRLRRCGLRHRAGRRRRERGGVHRRGLRRDQQQRERESSGTRANRMRAHPTCLASQPLKSADN